MRRAASRAACTAGNSRAINTAMIAITTSSSISVKPRRFSDFDMERSLSHNVAKSLQAVWDQQRRRMRDESTCSVTASVPIFRDVSAASFHSFTFNSSTYACFSAWITDRSFPRPRTWRPRPRGIACRRSTQQKTGRFFMVNSSIT